MKKKTLLLLCVVALSGCSTAPLLTDAVLLGADRAMYAGADGMIKDSHKDYGWIDGNFKLISPEAVKLQQPIDVQVIFTDFVVNHQDCLEETGYQEYVKNVKELLFNELKEIGINPVQTSSNKLYLTFEKLDENSVSNVAAALISPRLSDTVFNVALSAKYLNQKAECKIQVGTGVFSEESFKEKLSNKKAVYPIPEPKKMNSFLFNFNPREAYRKEFDKHCEQLNIPVSTKGYTSVLLFNCIEQLKNKGVLRINN